VRKNTRHELAGFAVRESDDLVDPLFVGGFGYHDQRALAFAGVEVVRQVDDGRHGFTHPHIKGIDAAAHRFHEGHAFALYVGDLKQSGLEAGRALKSDGHFGVQNI
jgi:hypothetical protein